MVLGVGVSPRKQVYEMGQPRSGVVRADSQNPCHTPLCSASYRLYSRFAKTTHGEARELCVSPVRAHATGLHTIFDNTQTRLPGALIVWMSIHILVLIEY